MSAPAPPARPRPHGEEHHNQHRHKDKGAPYVGPSKQSHARPPTGTPSTKHGKLPLPPLDAPHNPLNRPNQAFRCPIRFKNTLPEIPCDPKLLVPPLAAEQLAAFKLTSIEKDFKLQLPVLPGLGIPVTPLTYHLYQLPTTSQPLHPHDAALLEAAGLETRSTVKGFATGPSPGSGASRGRPAARMTADVSWLMRTTYISNDPANTRRMGEGARGGHLKINSDQDLIADLQNRNAQIAAIEQSFQAASVPTPVHPNKPGLRPVSIMPLLPALDLLPHHYIDVHYKEDPCKDLGEGSQARGRQMLLHSMLTERLKLTDTGQSTSYVALLRPVSVPDAPPDDVPPLPGPGETRQLQYGQEYQYTLNNDCQEGNVCVALGPDYAVYTELASKLDLKRPNAEGRKLLEEGVAVPGAVYLKRRRLIQRDAASKRARLSMANWSEDVVDYAIDRLGPVGGNEEEEDEDVDELEAEGQLPEEPVGGARGAGVLERGDGGQQELSDGAGSLFGSDDDDGGGATAGALGQMGGLVAGMTDDDDEV